MHFDITQVTRAWVNLTESTNNKFWGFMHLVRNANLPIEKVLTHGETYTVKHENLSISLQRDLYFGDTPRNFSTDRISWFKFSTQWIQKVEDLFLKKKPDVMDIIYIAFYQKEFEKEYSIFELLELLKKEFHFSDEMINNWFEVSEIYDIRYSENPIYKKILYQEIKRSLLITNNEPTLSFEKPYSITANAGELTRAPFIQTLYSAQETLECLLLTKFDFDKIYTIPLLNKEKKFTSSKGRPASNKILFGSPGSGKSFKLKEASENYITYRTTFHPEYDYASFVGAYKPIKQEGEITYEFVPQVFTNIYVEAWKNPEKDYCLIIEEINRGNCAAIFGDIFQLLDRNTEGVSEYPITTESDLANYLHDILQHSDYADTIQKTCGSNSENPYKILLLPTNLSIWATMNTSDQSLFPMDSAFKRRWEWEYLPINLSEAKDICFEVGTNVYYSWQNFLKVINTKIETLTESEDKQLGVWFAKHTHNLISKEVFQNKVMFYLWSDIFKHYDKEDEHYIFKTQKGTFTYADIFNEESDDILIQFLEYHNIATLDYKKT